jgi:hypothetical protein
VVDLERRASAAAAAGRSVADVDAALAEVEDRRSHREVDREQLLRKQVRGAGWLGVFCAWLCGQGGSGRIPAAAKIAPAAVSTLES